MVDREHRGRRASRVRAASHRATGFTLIETVVASLIVVVVLSLFSRLMVSAIDQARFRRARAHSATLLDRSIQLLLSDQIECVVGRVEGRSSSEWRADPPGFVLGPFTRVDRSVVTHRFVKSDQRWQWEREVERDGVTSTQICGSGFGFVGEVPAPRGPVERLVRVESTSCGDTIWARLRRFEIGTWLYPSGERERARVVLQTQELALVTLARDPEACLITRRDPTAILSVERSGVCRSVSLP